MAKSSSTNLANIFLDQRIILIGIHNYLLTNSRPQLVSKLFTLLCGYLGTKHLTTKTYQPQTSEQAERFDQTTVIRLRHSVAKHQQDWCLHVQPFSYAYSTQVRRSTNTSPYSLVLSLHPTRPSLMHAKLFTADNETLPIRQQMRCQIEAHLVSLRAKVDTYMKNNQAR